MTPPFRPLLLGRLQGAVFLPGAREDVHQAVIALVAGIFVDARRRGELILAAPRLGPGLGVFDLELVVDLGRGDAGEALGHLERVGGVVEVLLGIVAGGLDHQGVALVPADRIAAPLLDAVGAVGGVQADYADLVDHLGPDGDRVAALLDRVVIVVEARARHRLAHVDAALAERAALGVVVAPGGIAAAGARLSGAQSCFLALDQAGHPLALEVGRHPAVRRGDHGGARHAADAHHGRARVGPGGVVVAVLAAARAAVGGQVLDRGVGIGGLGGQIVGRLDPTFGLID